MGNTSHLGGSKRFTGSPDQYLFSGGESKNMIAWNLSDREVKHKVNGAHEHTISDIVDVGDTRHIASSSFDKTVKIWDVKTMECVRTLEGHRDGVRKICILGDLCLSASKDNTIKIWNVYSGELVDTYVNYCNGASDIKSIDKNTIATTNQTTIRLWDVNKKKLVQSFTTHFDWVIALEYDKSKDLLYSASWDKTIKLWDPRSRGLLTKPVSDIQNTNQINTMVHAKEKDFILIGDQGGNVTIFDMRMVQRVNKKKFCSFDMPRPIIRDQPHSEVVFKLTWMDMNRFASCAADKTIRLYDLSKLTSTGYILNDRDPITSILFYKDPAHHVDNFTTISKLKKMKKRIKRVESKKMKKLALEKEKGEEEEEGEGEEQKKVDQK